MFRLTTSRLLTFWVVKYIAFYVLLMVKNKNYFFLRVDQIRSIGDAFYYFFMLLFLPFLCFFLLSAPLYYLLKSNSRPLKVLILFLILAEYVLYTWLDSQLNYWNGTYNAMVSMLFIVLFFYKYIFPRSAT